MKAFVSALIALLFPVLLLAQPGREAQDASQFQKKLALIEKENSQLRKQLSAVQKSLAAMDQAETAERKEMMKRDSAVKACMDTVGTYNARIQKMESGREEIEHALWLRTMGFIILLIVIILLMAYRLWAHGARHRKDEEEFTGRLKAQREEREQRIGELRQLTGQLGEDLGALRRETGSRLESLSESISMIDRNMQVLIAERSNDLEQQIRQGIAGVKKDLESGQRDFLTKLGEVEALFGSRVSELGQKVVDSGKKLDEQITAAHRKAEDLKTVLAREIEAIRSKFE